MPLYRCEQESESNLAENGENQAANRRVEFVQAFKLNQIKEKLDSSVRPYSLGK